MIPEIASVAYDNLVEDARHDHDADEAMNRIWKEWFQFYQRHFRGSGIALSAADQMAFYEIAQPILRELARR